MEIYMGDKPDRLTIMQTDIVGELLVYLTFIRQIKINDYSHVGFIAFVFEKNKYKVDKLPEYYYVLFQGI